MKGKRLIAGLLSVSFLLSSCASKQVKLESEIIKEKKEEIKRKNEEIKKREKVDISLKKNIPLKVAIEAVCRDKGIVCDSSDVPEFLVSTKMFSGNLREFLRFLRKEYNITYRKYGNTLLFKAGDKYNKYYAMPILRKKININVSNVAFEYFLSILSDKAGVPIVIGDIAGESKGIKGLRESKVGYISYYSSNKTLEQILNEICGEYGYTWRVKDRKIEISEYESVSLKLNLPFLEKEIDLKDDAYTLRYKKKFYKKLEENLKQLLHGEKSRVSVTETGYVVVYGRPEEVRLIRELVEKINQEYSKVIPLKVTILRLELKDRFSAGINLLDLKDLDEIGKRSNTTNIKGLIDLTKSGGLTLGVTSKALDSIIEAVKEFGKVNVVENSEFRVLNGQPLVYKPLVKQRIVSNVELSYVPVSAGGSGGGTITQPTITMKTEDIESGSNLLIVPYYIDEDRVVIDLYRNQSQIEALKPFKVNLEGAENQLLLPVVKKDSSIQQTTLSEGQKMILLSTVIEENRKKVNSVPIGIDIPFKEGKEKARYQYLIIVSYEEEL